MGNPPQVNTMEIKMINTLSTSLSSLSNNHNFQYLPKNDAYIKNKQIDNPTFIPCYKGKQQYLMNANDIEYVYSNSVTGVHIFTNNEEFHTHWTLKTFEEQAIFTRCHRQYLINKRHIKMIEKLDNGLGKSHTYNGHIIPVSRRYLNKM